MKGLSKWLLLLVAVYLSLNMIPQLLYRTLVPKKYLFQENTCIGTGLQLTWLKGILTRVSEKLFSQNTSRRLFWNICWCKEKKPPLKQNLPLNYCILRQGLTIQITKMPKVQHIHCMKQRNFTQFPGMKILRKRTVSAEFRAIHPKLYGNYAFP